MLSLANEPADRFPDARHLLYVGELSRASQALGLALLLLLLTLSLAAAGHGEATGLLIGAVVSLSLSRYGPRWWPGKR